MVCVYCGAKTEVTNSRLQKRSNNVWRRRKCNSCKATFTTHETPYLQNLASVQPKNGEISPFIPEKLFAEIVETLKGTKEPYAVATEITAVISHNLMKNASKGPIKAQEISLNVGQALKKFNKQAWLRYVSEHPSIQPNN